MIKKIYSLESNAKSGISDNAYFWPKKEIETRRKIEKELHESEAKFRALTESSTAAILIFGVKLIYYVNRAFESITGFTKEETLSMHFREILHPDMHDNVKLLRTIRQKGKPLSDCYELKILTKYGQTKWIDVATTLISYEGETATLAMAYDITESKQAKDSLLAREQELKDKAHDLKEMNAALRVLLKKREEDKIELEEKIQFNVKQLIEPYLDDLKKTQLSPRQAALHGIIKTNLDEIVSPYVGNFASIKYKLTSQEIIIASLIRQRKTSKEIAELMCLSLRTIEFHRTKIRRKFGLKNKTDSLQAYLLSLH